MNSGSGNSQRLAPTALQMLIVGGGKLQRKFGTNDLEMINGTRRGARQQNHPSRLHIWQQWDHLQKSLVFIGRPLRMTSHEIRVVHRSTQNANALFVGGQSRSPSTREHEG